ncbi:CoA-transferase family III domain-containing protein [Talaromyces proteolyticus]|uniref:CoA-transferase family III domain-containing protein n=1 Tax=Talaromyces proteolyticus TaxID=1131652 RepID=A0AAD4KJG7_9EURO|nr:CoA-transferase family III domain-containing protein [Talaromyces proteolyticus]KAH8692394.1 CoA-transferase family III domain-containing protein [Talaromyces proteolyticus]
MIDRTKFTAADAVAYIWRGLHLPNQALTSLHLPNTSSPLPSSFKIDILAQTGTASKADGDDVPRVSVVQAHALAEFFSEKLYTLNALPPPSSWGRIGGLHRTADDGYVRIHDAFPHHEHAAIRMLGLASTPATAAGVSRDEVGRAIRESWTATDLETKSHENGAVIAALRAYDTWDGHPQASAVPDFPILIHRLPSTGQKQTQTALPNLTKAADKCLRGLRVLELSRVMAAPVAGRVLAAHGADVLWVTSANLPSQPGLDRDMARGKRSIRLDFKSSAADRATLIELIRSADVFIQSYRPGSLSRHGFGPDDVARMNPGIVYASLSAYGRDGPWAERRGYDSLVQTVSGMSVSEAEHMGMGEPARAMPCQALDHASGYLLATGIMAAVYRQLTLTTISPDGDDGAVSSGYEVEVSLAAVMKWLRSLGQYQSPDPAASVRVEEDWFETRMSGFGELKALKHAASVEGVGVGWDVMPMPLGSGEAVWL